MEEASDEFVELIPKLLASDRGAEERFYQLAYQRLMGWGGHNFYIAERDREDFALEVIEKTLARLNMFMPSKARFTTWMFVIARNHALDRTRKLQNGRDPLHGALSEDVLEWIETNDTSPCGIAEEANPQLPLILPSVKNALATLSEDDRHLLQLAFGTSLNATEIAEMMNMSSAAVRKWKQRILKKIRSLLPVGIEPTLINGSSTGETTIEKNSVKGINS